MDCLEPNYRTPISDLSRAVCTRIHRRQVALIILDEADRLDKTSWDLIRDLHERTHCAFLMVGQPDLTYRLRMKEPLLNRVSLTVEMSPLLFNEVIEFLCAWQVDRFHYTLRNPAQFCILPDDPDHLKMLKQIYQITLGNMRRLCYFIQEAEGIATLNGQKFVELPVVQATTELLVNTVH